MYRVVAVKYQLISFPRRINYPIGRYALCTPYKIYNITAVAV